MTNPNVVGQQSPRSSGTARGLAGPDEWRGRSSVSTVIRGGEPRGVDGLVVMFCRAGDAPGVFDVVRVHEVARGDESGDVRRREPEA